VPRHCVISSGSVGPCAVPPEKPVTPCSERWASLGFSAADIDPARRGWDSCCTKEDPIRLRSFHLTDATLAHLRAGCATAPRCRQCREVGTMIYRQSADWCDVRFVDAVVARTGNAESLERFRSQGEGCGWCTNPIRLRGTQTRVNRSTGETVGTYTTDNEPDGVLFKSCGTRRATRCPSCAATYAADAAWWFVPVSSAEKGSRHRCRTAAGLRHLHRTELRHCARDSVWSPPAVSASRCRTALSHGRSLSCWHTMTPATQAGSAPLSRLLRLRAAVLWNATCPSCGGEHHLRLS